MDSVTQLGQELNQTLLEGTGMNDFLHRFLEAIEAYFKIPKIVVYDYDETTDVFFLLYFIGYQSNMRSELAKRLHGLDPHHALQMRDPYRLNDRPNLLVIPLYFQETLEAIVVLESDNGPLAMTEERLAACRLVSRYLGLFMSSNRLPVNQRQQAALASDLERARDLQLTYLPAEHPVTESYEVYSYNLSSAVVGGDYFDYFRIRDDSIQGVVADACGHGLTAALIMSTFRGLLHSEIHRPDESATLFTRLNRRLYTGLRCLQFLTSVYFDYDAVQRSLYYFNAGHFDPLIIRPGGECERLTGGGPPLGMFEESEYEMQSARVGPGDLLVLFTDGLAELRNEEDHFFGEEGIITSLRDRYRLPLNELAESLLASAAEFSHKPRPVDDLTLFLMKIRQPGQA